MDDLEIAGRDLMVRRRGERWFGIVAMAASAAALLIILFGLRHTSSVWYRVQAVIGLFPAIWLMWLSSVHPSIRVTRNGVVVTNWFLRYELSWSAIIDLEIAPDLCFLLYDGRKIKAASGSGSLAGAMRGNRWQRALKDRIRRVREEVTEGMAELKIEKRLDVAWAQFLAIWLLIILYASVIELVP